MSLESASEKQIDYLCALLQARGVQADDCQRLINAVYPQGLSKREASAEIEQLKYMNGLPARWIHTYVRQLRRRHAISVEALMAHLQAVFDGAAKPAGLSRLQQQELLAWLRKPA